MFVGTFMLYLAANMQVVLEISLNVILFIFNTNIMFSGLGLSNDFVTLVIFRGLQAAGSAATISIGIYLIISMYKSV